ncbi:MAG: PPC domain-containing protein [Candidatus Thorarchaeota archaeon]
MEFRKNMKVGVSIIFLLLIFVSSFSLLDFTKNNSYFGENTLSLSGSIDDPMEDNDNYGNASSVIPNYYFNLTIIETDEDWFKLFLNPGDTIEVYIYFNHSEGDLDMELFDPVDPLTYRTGSFSTTNDEFLSYTADKTGEWRIRVYHYTGSTNVTYNLDIWVKVDDWMEENDDFWSAWGVGPGIFTGLKLVDFDEDWYQIYLNPGDIIDVNIYFNHSEGDLQLVLYDPSYSYRMDSLSMDHDEFITFMADMSGDWRIQVYHNYGNSTVLYDLDIWVSFSTIVDDWAEENDNFWSAFGLGPGFHSGLKVVGSDEDWFRIFLNPGDAIDVYLFFDHAMGDLQLELYDPSNSFRVGSYSSDMDEFLNYDIDAAGEWRIRVFHQIGDTDVYYDLEIYHYVKVDDNYEENDAEWQAYDLTPYEGWWLTWIGGPGFQFDDDWYKITVEPGFEHLIIQSPDFGWDIHLEIYDEAFNKIGGSNSKDDFESEDPTGTQGYPGPMRFDLPSSGIYYLKIFGNNRGYFYNFKYITVNLLEEQTWLSDIYSLGVQNNFDFYFIDITPGFQHLQVELLFNHSLGNIDMALYDVGGNKITNSSSFTDNEYIDTTPVAPGFYFLLVQGENLGNEYDLWWDDVKTDLRSDDYYEMNNNASSAYDLSSHEYPSLWEINGLGLQFNEDWYRIHVDDTHLMLIVFVIYDSSEGLMGFEVYDGYLTKLTGNFTLDDNDYIKYELPSNGTYYIRVYGDNSGNVYNLWWAAEEYDPIGMIPGYDTLILAIAIIGVSALVITIKRSKIKHQ